MISTKYAERFAQVKTIEDFNRVRDQLSQELRKTVKGTTVIELPIFNPRGRNGVATVRVPKWIVEMGHIDGLGLSVQLLGRDRLVESRRRA